MSENRNDLLNTVDRIIDEHCARPLRESAEAGEWPAGLWRALEAVGLDRAALPEEAGGSGLAFEDAMLALRRSAYHATPVPLAETMLAGSLLAAAGLAVPQGALSVAPVNTSDRLEFVHGSTRTSVVGVAHRVPWGNLCAQVVVVGELDGKDIVGMVSTSGSVRGVEQNLAGEPRALLGFDHAQLTTFAALPGGLARLQAGGALCRSVQMAGALERALEYSLLYANERVQFGRPIAKFQAIQHMLAQLAGQVAAASAAADAAVEASALAPDEFAVAVAKSRAGEAAGKGAEIAHQVHGAMGYTREHNLHYVTRRLWSWRDEFGNEPHWQRRLGRLVAAHGADALWPMLSGL
ncbi:MAG: acyl-CoA/acyl-ACP dehydrogenase [Burkholderiales bacterium]|nr:acyl-CoA/acyl-ACP dehydrogenase [Burkholderiales bacterium]